MFNRTPSRLARPSSTLIRPTTTSRLALTRTSIRTATTAHNEHRGDDTHGNHASGHDDRFDSPSGWLWGIRPGEKYEKEGWEGLAWVFVASWVVAVAAYTMKEDTSYVLPSCFAFLFALSAARIIGEDAAGMIISETGVRILVQELRFLESRPGRSAIYRENTLTD